MDSHTFCVADFLFRLSYHKTLKGDIEYLTKNFSYFRVETAEDPLFFMTVECGSLQEETMDAEMTIYTDNGDILVERDEDYGYKILVKDTLQRGRCMMFVDKDYSKCRCVIRDKREQFGLSNAIAIMFTLASARRKTVMIHASAVVHKDRGYAFYAESGTGKSTHTNLWMKCIEDTTLLNDDNPIIRVIGNEVFIYGSPWSGKTPCYKNDRVPLDALIHVQRNVENRVRRLDPIEGFTSLLPACSTFKLDNDIFHATCDTLSYVIEKIPVYELSCRPDEEAARICRDEIVKK